MRKALLSLLVLLSSVAFAQDSISQKLLQDIKFRSIGPAGMSGRITAIKVDARNMNSIYAGSASGGLWHSTNGGTSWNCIFNNEAVSSVGSLALDPANPDVIWLGTGEGNPRNSNTGGAGIYRSIDGGKSWQLMGLEQTRHIHRIIVHPQNSQVIFVAAIGNPWADSEHRGVYKSTDGGKTWKRVLYQNERTGAAEMVIDPLNPNKLIVNMWEHRRNPWFFKSGGLGSGMFISYDGGETWKQKTADHGLPKGELGRMGLAIAASQPNRVYAFIEKKGKNALYRSEDGGEKWRMISTDENIGNRPFYYAEIYVDPQNENRVYSIWSVISRSEDGGKTWEVIAPYSYIHPDHHAFFIHPEDPSYIINGNDGGMNISRDRGQSWRFVNNLPLAQFYHINYDMDYPYNIYGGMQDNGSWKGPAYVLKADGIRNSYWEELYFGDGFDVVPDPSNNRFLYAMSQEGYLGRVDVETGNTQLIRPVHPENVKLRYNWNAPIAQSPWDEASIYFGAQFVFKSSDRGSTWKLISPDLTTNDSTKQNFGESGGLTYDVTGAENYTTLLCIEAGKKYGELWVSSDDGRLHLSMDDGDNWLELTKGLKGIPAGAWIPQVVHSSHQEGAAFVVVNDYRRGNESPMLYYTDNYGKSFRNIASNLPAYVISVAQDIEDPNLIFAGTQRGLYFSWDMGEHWQKWGKDFPTVPVADMKIHPREHDLIIGTFGRSAWILDNLEELRAAVKLVRSANAEKFQVLPIAPVFKTAYKRADGSRFPADGVFKGENRQGGLQVYIYNAYTKADSIKQKKMKVSLIGTGNEVLRTWYQSPKEGLAKFRFSFYEKGNGFPSKNRKFGDTSEISALPLPAGHSYFIEVEYAGNKIRKPSPYLIGPRFTNMYAVQPLEDIYLWRKAMDDSLQAINDAADWIKAARIKLDIAQKLAQLQLDPDQTQSFKDSLKPIYKGLKHLEEGIYGREVDGYYDQPETLQSMYYAIFSYLGRSWEGVPEQSQILAIAYRKAEKEYLQKMDSFKADEWSKLEAILSQFNLSLEP